MRYVKKFSRSRQELERACPPATRELLRREHHGVSCSEQSNKLRRFCGFQPRDPRWGMATRARTRTACSGRRAGMPRPRETMTSSRQAGRHGVRATTHHCRRLLDHHHRHRRRHRHRHRHRHHHDHTATSTTPTTTANPNTTATTATHAPLVDTPCEYKGVRRADKRASVHQLTDGMGRGAYIHQQVRMYVPYDAEPGRMHDDTTQPTNQQTN